MNDCRECGFVAEPGSSLCKGCRIGLEMRRRGTLKDQTQTQFVAAVREADRATAVMPPYVSESETEGVLCVGWSYNPDLYITVDDARALCLRLLARFPDLGREP